MQNFISSGGLVPLWILGGPFVLGLFALFTTPHVHTTRDERDLERDRDRDRDREAERRGPAARPL